MHLCTAKQPTLKGLDRCVPRHGGKRGLTDVLHKKAIGTTYFYVRALIFSREKCVPQQCICAR